jgi:hypothetical protein
MNTARAPYIEHDSLEVKEVVDFADRFWCVLELKISKLRAIMPYKLHYFIKVHVNVNIYLRKHMYI